MDKEARWLLKEKYEGVESEAFHADLKRLETGEPLAYIINHIPFLDCNIYLDSHPLIPRSETEFWVATAINTIRERVRGRTPNSGMRVLDLCAGSGCIGAAVAKAIPEAHVTFGELMGDHLPTIALNLETNAIDCTRYKIFQSDLFENIDGQFDFILSNPPYIDPALDRTEASVKNFEPPEALYGGAAGLELIACIIQSAPQYLTPDGRLYLEHEPEQATAIANLAKANGLHCLTHTDQYSVPRYSVISVAK